MIVEDMLPRLRPSRSAAALQAYARAHGGGKAPLVREFVDTDLHDCGRVVRSERLLSRALRSPTLALPPACIQPLQHALCEHLCEQVPSFQAALSLSQAACTPLPKMLHLERWRSYSERLFARHSAQHGLALSDGWQSQLMPRLHALVAQLPGPSAGAMLLWQRFDAAELTALLDRPQRPLLGHLERRLAQDGLYRVALELRMWHEGETAGFQTLLASPSPPLAPQERALLRLFMNQTHVEEMLDVAMPEVQSLSLAQRAGLLGEVERWLYESLGPLPHRVDEGGQQSYLRQAEHRRLEQRLRSVQSELEQRWTAHLKEGVVAMVDGLIAELLAHSASPRTIRAG